MSNTEFGSAISKGGNYCLQLLGPKAFVAKEVAAAKAQGVSTIEAKSCSSRGFTHEDAHQSWKSQSEESYWSKTSESAEYEPVQFWSDMRSEDYVAHILHSQACVQLNGNSAAGREQIANMGKEVLDGGCEAAGFGQMTEFYKNMNG